MSFESVFILSKKLTFEDVEWLQNCGYQVEVDYETIDVTTSFATNKVMIPKDIIARIYCNSMEKETVLRLKYGDDLHLVNTMYRTEI